MERAHTQDRHVGGRGMSSGMRTPHGAWIGWVDSIVSLGEPPVDIDQLALP
jgi:hypothetical protein